MGANYEICRARNLNGFVSSICTSELGQIKLLWVEHGAANNLSAQVNDLLARLNPQTKSASSPISKRDNSYQNASNLSQLERGSYRNRFCAVRAAVPVVPLACAQSAPTSTQKSSSTASPLTWANLYRGSVGYDLNRASGATA